MAAEFPPLSGFRLTHSQWFKRLRQYIVPVLLLTAFFCFRGLFQGNMGNVNEVHFLPLARQFADPDWVPKDWYYTEPAGYRLLFMAVFGYMAKTLGFLAASILGRLIGYTLIAAGLVFLSRRLNLSLVFLLLAAYFFLYLNIYQGVVAQEWIINGIESKVLAYGFLLFGLGFMFDRRYGWMALMMGLSASFHVLVGGWAGLATLGWLLLRRRQDLADVGRLGRLALIYLVSGAFAIWPVLQQFTTPEVEGPISPSYLYVFIRTPHHLNPLAWDSNWWIRPLIYLAVMLLSAAWLWRQRTTDEQPIHTVTRRGLAEWTLLGLVPFAVGVAIAPLDRDGNFLQYYPFRVGDVMLPLVTALLLSCALEQLGERVFKRQGHRIVTFICIVFLVGFGVHQWESFSSSLQDLRQFPGEGQGVDNPELREMYSWIRDNTPEDAVIITPPVEFVNFTWITERATVVKFRFVPSTSGKVMAWYERLNDLSGSRDPWANLSPTEDNRGKIYRSLTTGYSRLRARQVTALMDKYQASYFFTDAARQLELPVAHRSGPYMLYQQPQ